MTVRVHEAAVKQLKAIPADHHKRILDDVFELAKDPFLGLVKPLKDKDHNGKYRKVSGPLPHHFQTNARGSGGRSAGNPPAQRKDVSVTKPLAH